jgi:hypothetical protein
MPRPILYAIALLLAIAAFTRLFQSPDALGAIGGLSTTIARSLFIPLVVLISKPSFVYVASTLIVLSAAIIVAIHLGGTVRRELSALKAASRAIARLNGPALEAWPLANSEITTIISKYNVLASAWTSYAQETNQTGRLPARRFALFAEADPWNPVNRRGSIVESLPSYYTTIGLILTFVGLVVALYFAAKGFQSGDMAQAREAIVQLLNASAFKFLTSVAALIGALMISVAHRTGQWWLRRAVHEFSAAVDLRLQAARVSNASSSSETGRFDQLAIEMKATRTALEALTRALNASAPKAQEPVR